VSRQFAHTDSGNAEFLVHLYGKHFRFVKSWGRYIVWTGTHWEEDLAGIRIGRFAKRTVRKIPALKWRKKSEELRRRYAMVTLAREERDIAISHTDLDKDPWLLNVKNGTIDLKTGEIRAHDPADLITKLAPVEYNPQATCERWERFLTKVMGNDEELVSYLQRFVGYSLTGITREQALIFHYGDGNNGKSTFIKTLHKILGNYATRAARGVLFRNAGASTQHLTSIASFHGRRFVSCPEVDEDQEFDEGLIKDLTGDDPIAARYMRQDEWVFVPIHKLWFAGNAKPRVKGRNTGIWRRVQMVPWEVIIPKAQIDKKLDDKLLMEASGILNWALKGCLEWQHIGLAPPARVLAATAEYRKEQDSLGQFFDECFVFESIGRITRKRARERYEEWCEEFGHHPVGAKKFGEALRRKHAVDGRVWDKTSQRADHGWYGVREITRVESAKRALVENSEQLSPEERAKLQRVIERASKKHETSHVATGATVIPFRKK
jgi:putative DNA primase/helicase